MLFTWLKKRNLNNQTYQLKINNKKTNITIKRLRSISDHIDSLIRENEFKKNKGFFKYKEIRFQSFFLTFRLDLIFVDDNGKIIKLIQNFKPNTYSEKVENSKFLYIFPENFVTTYNIKNEDIISHYKKITHKWYE